MSLANNKLELCEYIYKTKCKNSNENSLINIFNIFDLSLDSVLQFICRKNIKLDTIKYLFNLLEQNNIIITDTHKNEMINILCCNNNVDICDYIYNTMEEKFLDVENVNLQWVQTLGIFIKVVLRYSNIKLLKWVLEKLNITKKEIIDNHITINTIQSLLIFKNSLINDDIIEENEEVNKIEIEEEKNNIRKKEFLEWLFENEELKKFINKKTLIQAIKTNNLNLIKYIYEKRNKKDFIDVLSYICDTEDLEILKWYLNIYCIYTQTKAYKLFNYVCENGTYDLALYIYNRYNIKLTKTYFKDIFKKTLKSLNIRTILWLYSLKPEQMNIYLDEEWIKLCKLGNYQLIRWILINKNININIWQGFKIAVLEGKIDIMKLLLNYNKNLLNLLSKNIELYKSIISKGYYDILEWLNEKKLLDINIIKTHINKRIIKTLCNKQYIEMLEWLTKNIDITDLIRDNDDEIFINMCDKYNTLTIRFLVDKFDIYSFKIDDDNVIAIIKDTPEYYYEHEEYEKIIELYEMKKNNKEWIENVCMVCYDNTANIKTNCNHYYCKFCIFKWYIYKSEQCPYCRTDINLQNSSYI